MDNIKSNLKGVVGSSACGLPLKTVERDYFNVTHSQLDYWSYGYSSIQSFLEDIPDIVKIVQKDGQLFVMMVVTKQDPKTLKELAGLIKNTRNRKKTKPIFYNDKVQKNHYVDRIKPDKFMISVPNDYFTNSLPNVSKASSTSHRPIDGNSMISSRINNENSFNGQNNKSKISVDQGPRKSMNSNSFIPLINGGVKSSKNGFAASSCNGHAVSLSNGFNTPVSNSHMILRSNVSDNQPRVSNDWGCWFLKPVINFEVLNKRVNVLGIQSGQAVVVGVHKRPDSNFLKSKNVLTFFPGDIILWQPPFNDSQRRDGFVDLNSTFPATVIKRSTAKKILVRILGLITLLEVFISDIFEIPSSCENLSKMVKVIKSREITMVTLAFIPNNIDIWDNTLYAEVYSVLLSIDEGGLILERSTERGEFLNLIILNYIQENMLTTLSSSEKTSFLNHLLYLLDRSKSAIFPTYENLISGNDVYPEGNPLRLIYNVEECKDETMIGSKNLVGQASQIKRNEFSLLRLKFWDNRMTFYSVDDQSIDVPVPPQRPLEGVYIVNEKFISCNITKNDPLRFKTALLALMPSMIDLSLKMGLHNL